MSKKNEPNGSKRTKNEPKTNQKRTTFRKSKYVCEICDYITFKKANYTRHMNSKKHKKKCIENCDGQCTSYEQNVTTTIPHTQWVDKTENEIVGLINPDYQKLVEENQKLKEKLLIQENEHLKEQVETLKTIKGNSMGSHNNINSNNTNNITVNMYLNDHCKDAMFLDDFVNQIKLKLADVMQGEMPVENAISNVFIQKLEDLDPTERPIHCTDQKRKQFMVNDKSEGWIKDDTIGGSSKLKNSLTTVQQKAFLDVYDEFDEKYKPPHEDQLERKKSKLVGLIRNPLISGKGTKQILKDVAPVTNIRDAIKELKSKE